jgi:hypothetical protein
MKLPQLGLAMLLMTACGIACQTPPQQPAEPQQEQQQPPPQQEQQQEQQPQSPPSLQRPTLGPASAPSLGGPRASSVVDPRRLMRVRKVFIMNMDNSLSEKLIETMGKGDLFQVVNKRQEADAVFGGSCFEARRIRRVHTEVYLSDRITEKIIWQDVIRVPFNPPTLESAVSATAAEILAHLRLDIREAPRKRPAGM